MQNGRERSLLPCSIGSLVSLGILISKTLIQRKPENIIIRSLFPGEDFLDPFAAPNANLHPRISQRGQRANGRGAMAGISLLLSKFNPRRIGVARFEFSDQKWTRIPLSDRRVHWQTTERDNEKEEQAGIYREKKLSR